MSCSAPVLLIGGWDSSRGAGLDADREVLASLGHPARVVLTAVTEQGQNGVRQSWVLPPDALQSQIEAAVGAGGVGAVKIGMLGTAEAVEAVTETLGGLDVPVVLDPVISATHGGELLSPEGVAVLRDKLAPQVTLITPNLPELEALGGSLWARNLGTAVLVKGGHGESEVLTDRLWLSDGSEHFFEHVRIPGASPRGTGCRLATAIAGSLALHCPLHQAVSEGIDWLQNYLKHELWR